MSLYKIFEDFRLKDCPLCDDRSRLEICNCSKFEINVKARAMCGNCSCKQCVGLEDFPWCGDDQYWYETKLTTSLDVWLKKSRLRQVASNTICVIWAVYHDVEKNRVIFRRGHIEIEETKIYP